MKNIYLIGMPGSGKTTLGGLLASKYKLNYIDLDNYIEHLAKKSIEDLFKVSEDYFRNYETKALNALKNTKDTIISCGGGIVLRAQNKALMNGYVIYLETDLKTLEKRLHQDTKRPLLKNNSLLDLYNQRKDLYLKFADYKIKATNSLYDNLKALEALYENLSN